MQKLLTSNIIPSNHPIKDLPEKLKIRYLKGLGEALCLIEPNSQKEQKAKFCYDVLCESFLGNTLEGGWEVTKDLRHIKKAQNLCRFGLKFFRMSDCFWWDVYRIAYQSELPIESYDSEFQKTTGIFTTKFREAAKKHFLDGGNGEGLHKTLVAQSKDELNFCQRPLKRILVVGTVSAGKSTVINALVGRKVAQMRTAACTSQVSEIFNNPFCEHLLYIADCKQINYSKKWDCNSNFEKQSLRFTGSLDSYPIVIMDTPGVDNALDESHGQITRDTILGGEYDILICVVNAPYVERTGENEMIEYVIHNSKKKIIFIFNQLDRFRPSNDSIEESLDSFRNILKSKNSDAQVVPLSAISAFLLKKEKNGQIDEFDEIDLEYHKKKLFSPYYDMGLYGTGHESGENDFLAKSGIINLENIIVSQ